MSLQDEFGLSADELKRVLHVCTGASMSVIDRSLRFRYVNADFARAFKLPAREVVGCMLVDLYNAETVRFVKPYIQRALTGETVTYERMGRIHEEDQAWMTVSISPWRLASGEIAGVVTTTLRVHELRIANEKLRAATERLASHVENSPLTVLELDADLCVTRCSARAETMLGVAPAQLLGQSLLTFLDAEQRNIKDSQPLKTTLKRLLAGDDLRSEVQIAFVKPAGEQVYLTWFCSALAPAQSQKLQESGVLCLIEDISAKRQAELQLLHMVTHDPLTGLVNRRGLADGLKRLLLEVGPDQRVWCLYIDLDGFKEINDRHGHAAGDAVLIEVARRFRAALPLKDIVARVGGDEFVVLLQDDAPYARASTVGALLLQVLEAPCRFAVQGVPSYARVGASIGAASHPPQPADATELIKLADAAMYRAKHGGKNRMVLTAIS